MKGIFYRKDMGFTKVRIEYHGERKLYKLSPINERVDYTKHYKKYSESVKEHMYSIGFSFLISEDEKISKPSEKQVSNQKTS